MEKKNRKINYMKLARLYIKTHIKENYNIKMKKIKISASPLLAHD